MADIDIVPKRRSHAWLWTLLALVAIALLAWMLMSGGDRAPQGAIPTGDGQVVALETDRAIAA